MKLLRMLQMIFEYIFMHFIYVISSSRINNNSSVGYDIIHHIRITPVRIRYNEQSKLSQCGLIRRGIPAQSIPLLR